MNDTLRNPAFTQRERRCRTLWIAADLMLNLALGARRHGDEVETVRMEGLPEGVEIAAVCYSFERHAFGLELWHAAFDVVPDSDMAPEVGPVFTVERLRVERTGPDAVVENEFALIPLDPHLLAALLDPANESDDGLRMAIADWLKEHGEAERGELVAVQCRIASLDLELLSAEDCEHPSCAGCAERRTLRRRERELLDSLRYVLTAGLPGKVPLANLLGDGVISIGAGDTVQGPPKLYRFRRGFLHAVTCSATDFLTYADAILGAQPVREVVLTSWPDCEAVTTNEGHIGVRFCGRTRIHDWRKYADWRKSPQPVPDMLATEWPGVRFVLPLMSEEEARILHGDPNADLPLGVMHVRDRHRGG